ncbi:PEP-CTERM sorting domain-containing protein [Colwellia sp. BRX10-4]|uniref:PEP-CTERM sorting domain-containing protein n=1 Tax=Colwellia sp. BRX10-4 TaxID=2759843 RepID=UPI002174EEEA|nr:PEP-CTERM sorting domain-containing protein [Colwellia sp. BRX10-4]
MSQTLTSGLIVASAAFSNIATAGMILFVSDNSTDSSIASVLSNAGHTVDISLNQYSGSSTLALLGNLNAYDAIYWSATGNGGGGYHNDSGMFNNLSNYVTAGGNVFVTGYDSVASPNDVGLMQFLGGSGGAVTDGGFNPGAISNIASSLTTGLFDIRGLIPTTTGTQTTDRDSFGQLGTDTIGIVAADNGDRYSWTLRSLGLGDIAYVSNGNNLSSGESSMWADDTTTYSKAVRNFAENAGATTSVPEPSTLAIFALGIMGLASRRFKK